jgi:hypothetical protein
MPRHQCRLSALAAFATLLMAAAVAAEEQPQPVQAIWKPQEITFYFQSFTTFYSCSGLENKLERLLKSLGVTADVKVRAAECPSGTAQMPRVVMKVTAPVEATPDALAERDKDKSTRDLSARVNGKEAEQALAKSLEQFPAQWRRVSLSRGKLDIEPGDCELIDELRRKVLPKLAIRIVKNNLQCSPNQLTLGQPQLEVEALVALPKPDEAMKKKKQDEVKLEVNVDQR